MAKRTTKLQNIYMEMEGIDEVEELLDVAKWEMLQALAMEGGSHAAKELLSNSSDTFSTGDWKEVRRMGNDWDVMSQRPSTVRRITGTKPHLIPVGPGGILSNYYNPYRSGVFGTYGHSLFASKRDVWHPGTAPDRDLSTAWEATPRVATEVIGLIFTGQGNIQTRASSGRFGRNL